MSQREKHPERQEFFKLKMRAQRQRDGRGLLSLANWLFDVTSDYGWGVGKAFGWWAGHMAAMCVVLTAAVFIFPSYADPSFLEIVWDSFLVSFANAHAILGLASEGGYLYDARVDLMTAAEADSVLSAVGTTQAVIGPILLFLVLLTLRNRFRLG